MPVSRRLRFEILRRDGHTCRYCGAKAPDVTLTVDHVIPTALGGGDEPHNLIAACADCNAGKSSINPDAPLVEDVDAAALLWAKAMERAAAQRQEEAWVAAVRCETFRDSWERWYWGDDPANIWSLENEDGWKDSIARFMANGLTIDELIAMIPAAMDRHRVRNRFRYFCGIAWGEISERQELARRLIEDGEV